MEVMNKEEVPTSWRVAEIISGNGHTYSVRYDCYSVAESDVVVERVSRKVIRPCPPPVQAVDGWVAGDVAEVFVDNSWKISQVLKVLGGDFYLVRPHGLIQKFRIYKGSIRMRQFWEDGKWVLIGKGSESSGEVKFRNCYQKLSFQVPQVDAKVHKQGRGDCLSIQNDAALQDLHIISSRTPKRATPYYSSLLDPHAGNAKKFRAIEKEGRRLRVPDQLLEKVDAVAYPRDVLGEKYMQPSFNNCSNGYYETERRKSNGVVGCSLARISDPNESEIDECSIGSCSVLSENPNKISSHLVAVTCQEADTLCSDAESFHGSREEQICSPPLEEDMVESIHRLELHAYRSTLEALYASGPLSWEKEALLTNLRISLHISNDEHLIEVRNLISHRAGYLN